MSAVCGAEPVLPALDLLLRLGDERRDLALASLDPLLPLDNPALALVEALDAELVVDQAQGVTLVERRLALVELAAPVGEFVLGRLGAGQAPLGPCALTGGVLLPPAALGFTLGELALAGLEPATRAR